MCSNTGLSGATNKTLDIEQHLKSDGQEVFVSFCGSELKEQCSVKTQKNNTLVMMILPL